MYYICMTCAVKTNSLPPLSAPSCFSHTSQYCIITCPTMVHIRGVADVIPKLCRTVHSITQVDTTVTFTTQPPSNKRRCGHNSTCWMQGIMAFNRLSWSLWPVGHVRVTGAGNARQSMNTWESMKSRWAKMDGISSPGTVWVLLHASPALCCSPWNSRAQMQVSRHLGQGCRTLS